MVDCGGTSHIITEKNQFMRFDECFDPKKHCMELADESRMNNVVLKQGETEMTEDDTILLIIWVDDLITAASNKNTQHFQRQHEIKIQHERFGENIILPGYTV